jgi:hypothetical protein
MGCQGIHHFFSDWLAMAMEDIFYVSVLAVALSVGVFLWAIVPLWNISICMVRMKTKTNKDKPEGIKDRVMEGSEVMRMIFVCRCSDV